MKRTLQAALLTTWIFTSVASAEVVFYSRPDFQGRSFSSERQVWNFERYGFNDRASSVVVRGGRWELCEHARFEGRCVVLRPGRYRDLREMGMDNQVSSARPVSGRDVRREEDRRGGYR